MPGDPYLPLYTGDLLRNRSVACLSIAAFGGWLKTICYMWDDEADTIRQAPEVWARMWSCDQADAVSILAELSTTGVADVTQHGDGTVSVRSRRMTRELIKRQDRRTAARRRYERWRDRQDDGDDGPKKPDPSNALATRSQRVSNACLSESEYDTTNGSNEKKDEEEETRTREFESWWDAYDKKRGKADAVKVWRRLSAAKRRRAMEATPDYVASTPDKQYRKDPATWLRHEGWDDEIIRDTDGRRTAPAGRPLTKSQRAALDPAEFFGLRRDGGT